MKKLLALFALTASIVMTGCGSTEADGSGQMSADGVGKVDANATPPAPTNDAKAGAKAQSIGVDDPGDQTGVVVNPGAKSSGK